MDKDTLEATGDNKQVLEYYNLYGRNRDIKRYLSLPVAADLNSSDNLSYEECSTNINPCITPISNLQVKPSSSSDIQDYSQIDEVKDSSTQENTSKQSANNPKNENIITVDVSGKGATVSAKLQNVQKLGESKNKHKKLDMIFNVESQIEINYETNCQKTFSEKGHSAKSDKVVCKPKSILKVDDRVKSHQRQQKSIDLSSNIDRIYHMISPTSSIASNRRHTVSPTSSVASNKRLEWDSLADVGYNNTDDISTKYPLSTLERIALEQRRQSQYKQETHAISSTVKNDRNEKNKMDPTQMLSACQEIGKPTAESTPLVPKLDSTPIQEVNLISDVKSDVDKLSVDDNTIKNQTEMKVGSAQSHKSSKNSDAITTAEKVDKFIQTTLSRHGTLEEIYKSDTDDFKLNDSDKKSTTGKENSKKIKTPIKNKYKSRLLRKQRIVRRKLASTTPFRSKFDENSPTGEGNVLEALKGDSRFNISQSSIATNLNSYENRGMRADSFEYVAGDAYDDKSTPDDTSSTKESKSLPNSNVCSMKRSKKVDDVSNISSSKCTSNNSSSSKIMKESSESNNKSSNDELFGDAKFSTLNRDIKTSVRLLNALIANNKGNLELKKRLVRKVVKRLTEANYVEDSVSDSTVQSKRKSKSSEVAQSSVNSTMKSFPSSATTDPSYSLPEHLIANVPWKPSKFCQGVDYIRLPPLQKSDTLPLGTRVQHEKQLKGIYTILNKDDKMDRVLSNSSTDNSSFKDLAKNPEKSLGKLKILNEQQKILSKNLVKQQDLCAVSTDKQEKFEMSSDLLSYAKKEKDKQLSWINTEIQHLNYIKMLLESQGDKSKFIKSIQNESHKVSSRGDNKFDFSFFSNLSDLPNDNIVYPVQMTSENVKSSDDLPPSTSTNAEDNNIKNDELSTKSSVKDVKNKSSVSTNTSSSSSRSSIKEQIKQLTRNIELLKKSTQYAKNNSTPSGRSTASYTEWDSHVNPSRPYSEVVCIHESRDSRLNRPASILKNSDESHKSKSSIIESGSSKIAEAEDTGARKNLVEMKTDTSISKSDKVETSSDTHTSLKSATISINGQNVLSKSTEHSRASFSVDPEWELYLKRKLHSISKPNVQTISTQTSDTLINNNNKTDIKKIKSCCNCKRRTCRCKKLQPKSKSSETIPKPIAYILTFEDATTPSSSSNNRRKPSLEEVRITIPYNRERSTTSKKKIQHVEKNKKSHIKSDEKQHRESGSERKHSHFSSSNDISEIPKENSSSSVQNSESVFRGSSLKVLFQSNAVPEGSESMRTSIPSSTLNSSEKSHKPTIQECLMMYKSDFVTKAERRREIIQNIAELRSQRNAQRKKLLQLIDDKPEIQKEINKVKKILPQPPKVHRIFTSKEIRAMSRKKYKNLPEVTQKKHDTLRNNLYRNNRFIANIFNKKLQKRVLQGKLSVSNSSTVANGYD